ncbi:MAG: glyoxalase superfamily protein [Rubrivivax sp.]
MLAKDYRHARPEVHQMPWGTRDFTVTDPFGNRLTFTSAIST